MVARRKTALAAIIFSVLVLLSVNIGWWWYYRSMTTYLERQLSHRLTSVAATATLHLTSAAVDQLLIENLDAYASTLQFLDSLSHIHSLSEASIIDLDFNYLVSTRTDISSEGYLLVRLNFDSLQQAISGRPVASTLYNIEGTYLKSAYAPLLDDSNDVAALMVVEAGAGYFDLLTTLRRNLVFLAGGSAGVACLFLIFYIIYHRRLAAAEEKIFRAGSQAALGRMVAVVSHEIKNPLMILRAAGERLEKKYADPEAAFIIEEVARLDGIVSGYLSFARGDETLHLEPCRLPELLADIVARLRQQYDQSGVAIETDIDETLPPILADGVGLRQVILNLLLNALQAASDDDSGENGRVVLSLSGDGVGRNVRLRIANSGPGIKPGQREKLFEPFFTTRTRGSGLGLYLSRRIIFRHGGEITIVDSGDGLTTFDVLLPTGERQ